MLKHDVVSRWCGVPSLSASDKFFAAILDFVPRRTRETRNRILIAIKKRKIRLRCRVINIGTEGSQSADKRLTDIAVYLGNTFPFCMHDHAVRQLISMENCPTSRRTSDNIDPLRKALRLIEIVAPLIVADRNGVRIPTINAQCGRSALLCHSHRKELINIHVMRTGMKS
jgi:hypothetical protein